MLVNIFISQNNKLHMLRENTKSKNINFKDLRSNKKMISKVQLLGKQNFKYLWIILQI